MKEHSMLSVHFNEHTVGTLATTSDRLVAFEYDAKWLRDGFSINPFSLPLQKGVFVPKSYEPFEGLFGVFSDSLPDGWGRLLVDRLLRKEGINPAEMDSLNRLAIISDSGMGALSYHPKTKLTLGSEHLSLDEIARQCKLIFEDKESTNIDEIFRLGGSSGGARPKVNYRINNEEWIVKFPSAIDYIDIGLQEYEYSLCAKQCGIQMSTTRLMPSSISSGYFATKRFDREGNKCIHMVSVSALLETSHRIPNLDYHILMRLTLHLTNDYRQIEQLFRRMCFNVFSHNRDDHSKNFSFLYDYDASKWILAPAYDLTYSNSIGGEHATTINGNGLNPGKGNLLAVAKGIKFDQNKANSIITEIEEKVQNDLNKWLL